MFDAFFSMKELMDHCFISIKVSEIFAETHLVNRYVIEDNMIIFTLSNREFETFQNVIIKKAVLPGLFTNWSLIIKVTIIPHIKYRCHVVVICEAIQIMEMEKYFLERCPKIVLKGQ